jgi:uncharacterized protein Yka (UPF0111/DUF47 family)
MTTITKSTKYVTLIAAICQMMDEHKQDIRHHAEQHPYHQQAILYSSERIDELANVLHLIRRLEKDGAA